MLSVFPKSSTLLGFVRKLHRRPESERFFVWQGRRSRRYWSYRRWSRTSSRRKTSRSKPDRVFRHSLPTGLQQQALGNIVGSAGRTFKENSGWRNCSNRPCQNHPCGSVHHCGVTLLLSGPSAFRICCFDECGPHSSSQHILCNH